MPDQAKKKGQWPKGVSGNPNGRPKTGDGLADRVREALAKKGKDGKVHLDAIIDSAIVLARVGDSIARSWLSERGYGRALQEAVVEGTLEIVVRYADD